MLYFNLIFSFVEETGFEDPLGSNFIDTFDLVSYVGNDSE